MRRFSAGLALAAILFPGPAASAAPAVVPIQPGARLLIGGWWCTANFVFADGEERFIGTAGHCVGTGSIVRDETGRAIGPVVFSVNNYPSMDFALIRIDESRFDDVSPAMRVWGGPTGIAATGPLTGETTRPGTLLRQHGYGTTFERSSATQPRTGVLVGAPNSTFDAALPCSGGDSGSGVILASGEALGVLDVATLAPGGLHPAIQSVVGKISPRCGGVTLTNVLRRLRLDRPGIELVTAPLAESL